MCLYTPEIKYLMAQVIKHDMPLADAERLCDICFINHRLPPMHQVDIASVALTKINGFGSEVTLFRSWVLQRIESEEHLKVNSTE